MPQKSNFSLENHTPTGFDLGQEVSAIYGSECLAAILVINANRIDGQE